MLYQINKHNQNEIGEVSACSGHFQKATTPRSQGSFLQFMEELVKVGHTMGYKMDGCIKNIEEIIEFQGVMKSQSLNFFLTILDLRFTLSPIRGKWIHSSKNYLIISIYAPQELSDKKVLWDYLHFIIDNWAGASIFNSFISSSGLVDVPMGGCSFTWVHKSAAKLSKLDRFLISEGLMESCPNISAISLDRYLSDHRPILLRELCFDYGPIPFRFYHYWFELEDLTSPSLIVLFLDKNFPIKISSEVQVDCEKDVSFEETKKGSLDCGMDNLQDQMDSLLGFIGDIGVCHVQGCFNRSSNLYTFSLVSMPDDDMMIYMPRATLWGSDVDDDIVNQAAHSIGCLQLKSPFSYLGSRIGGSFCLV
ncbi:RNA-directed DNA polymerase, eukaryota [Tanacetum coccineum]